jgi:transmembrane sensor
MTDTANISRALDEAIAWHLRLGEADEKIWAELTAWLEADPANRLAFDRVEDFDAELGDADLDDAPVPNQFMLRRVAPWIAVAGLAASAVLAIVLFWPQPQAVEYATRTGETRSIVLADGTHIDLNTATVLLAGPGRRVTLEKGQALFHVTKNTGEPFIVAAGDRTIRDIGTIFDVLRDSGVLTVVVAEGRVGVSPPGGAQEVALAQGDKLVHSETTGSTTVEKVDPEQALAWRQGYLVYRNAPLSAVVRDLNRYFPVPIALDEGAAAQRFSGVLKIDSQDAVLDRLSRFLPVKVDRGGDGKITLRAIAARP